MTTLTFSELKVKFTKYLQFINVTLLPYQEELVDELLQFPYTAKVTQCRQSGKSFIMGLLVYFLMYVLHWDVVITAPKIDQTWAIMRHVHMAQDRLRAKNNFDNRYSISLKRRGSVICLSGSEKANVEGASAHLVIIDEHQDVDASHAAEVFIPMLSWTDGLYWSSGIGGHPSSVSQRDEVDFDWKLPYDKVVEVKPNYKRLVEVARREMLPEQFAAHYECAQLDISSHLLIPHISEYDTNIDLSKAITRCGIDWGKRVDQSVVTVTHHLDKQIYISDWLVVTGSYDKQLDEIVKFLSEEVEYDEIIPESNGVGDAPCDFLVSRLPGVKPLQIDQTWKTRRAQEINKKVANKTLVYNPKHPLSNVFVKDVTRLEYRMLDTRNIKVDHSDFLSSLMLAVEGPGLAYV